ncbi:MAG TPA: hypothetical protein PLJ84_05945 [Bacteroidales bacterium]|nr:hypothetical protein [Bacteroidales bacterium]HPT02121.1 hypothetical protein [Bacteroidales bacterium]
MASKSSSVEFETYRSLRHFRNFLRRPKYPHATVNRIVPHVAWIILFWLAAYLYKERIFADSGFYFSQFVNNKTFWIECQRIVLAFSQIIPLAGVWAGIPLQYVLLLYSLSHVAFFYFLFIFVYYGMRDRRSGLLIILSQTVGIMYSFFTPMFELYYGVPLLITFYAFWRLELDRPFITLILIILEILLLLSHPVAFILFVFLLLYDIPERRESRKPLYLYILVALVYVGVVIYKGFTMCEYETGKLAWQFNFTENKTYLQLLDPAYYNTMALFFLKYYWEVIAALLVVTITLLKQRQWFRLLLTYGFLASYLFLVNSAYAVSQSRYMEQVMFPVVPIVFIPLIYSFPKEPRPGIKNISVFLIGALIAYRLFIIYEGSHIFVQRTRQMESLISSARQMGGSKFYVYPQNIDRGYTQFNWSYPLETLILSSIRGNNYSVTIAPFDDLEFQDNIRKMGANDFLFRRWEIKDKSWLNSRYFHLDPGLYRTMNDQSPNDDLEYMARNFRIAIETRNYYNSLDTVWMKVHITNTGTDILHTGSKNKIFLSYFWKKDGDVLNWTNIQTPVESDIVHSLTQDMLVAVPSVKGKLQLQVDIISVDKQWFGLNATKDILVY